MNSLLLYSLVVMLMVLPLPLRAQVSEDDEFDYGQPGGGDFSFQLSQEADKGFVFYKDPFESYLPKEAEGSGFAQEKRGDLGPPPVTIEGILWGTDRPMAIIDGEVYGVGDMLQTVDAKVFKIKSNTVFISYGERIYEMNVKTTNVETKGAQ